jgi:hypothetical protein
MSDTKKQVSSGISFVEIYFFLRLLFRAVLLGLVLIALSEWYLSSSQKSKPAWLVAIEGAYYDGAYLAMKVAGWAFGTSQSQTTVRNLIVPWKLRTPTLLATFCHRPNRVSM